MRHITRRNLKAVAVLAGILVAFGFAPRPSLAGKPGGRFGLRGKAKAGYSRIRRSVSKPRVPRYASANQAMKMVRSGHRVLLPTEAGASQMLVDALVKRASGLRGRRPVEVLHTASMVPNPTHGQADPSKLRVNALFINGGLRKMVPKLKVTPTYLSEIPKLLDRQLRPDVMLIKVSPPDRRGYVNTGVSAGLIADLVANPKIKVIAEVTPHMPRTRGETRVHQSHIDVMVKSNQPMAELKWGATTAVDRAIGKNVARQVPNGSTLQLGIGPLQKAVGEQLARKGKKVQARGGRFKVRIRSEMIDDGLVSMANAGIISRSRNSVQLGFAVGTRKLYDFLGQDKRVKMVSTRKINDPYLAGKRNKLMAINSAVQVDLLGQACSEAVPRPGPDGKIRPVQYSGVGGQVDFFRAAQRSRGGKGFLTLRSTARHGTLSSISLDMGSQLRLGKNGKVERVKFDQALPVTTNRYDVDRVATEWGVAKLKGRDTVARGQALVRVAHPRFRNELARIGQQTLGGDAASWNAAARVSAAEWKQVQQFDAAGQ